MKLRLTRGPLDKGHGGTGEARPAPGLRPMPILAGNSWRLSSAPSWHHPRPLDGLRPPGHPRTRAGWWFQQSTWQPLECHPQGFRQTPVPQPPDCCPAEAPGPVGDAALRSTPNSNPRQVVINFPIERQNVGWGHRSDHSADPWGCLFCSHFLLLGSRLPSSANENNNAWSCSDWLNEVTYAQCCWTLPSPPHNNGAAARVKWDTMYT